jgi:hypothetical protein
MLRVQSILGLADDDVDDLMKLGELNNTKIGEFIRDFMNKDIRNVNAAVFQCTDDWFMAMEEDQSKGYLYSEIAFCLITNFEAYDVNID